MTPQEVMKTRDAFAVALNGKEYGKEGSPDFFKSMASLGFVAVYGASDDLMEFEGAIRDEIGCYGGGSAYVTKRGMLNNDCQDDDCPYFKALKLKADTITAKWDVDGFSWKYETSIPHAKFIIKEDGENYCEGIVFYLGDCKAID